jgi:proteasome lid subunit RPN8/RPN11
MDYRELANADLERKSAPAAKSDFRVFIAEGAFDRICSNAEMTREVGGMLVGEVLRDENGPFVHVETVIEALYAEERGAELTLTHETWNDIHGKMDTLYAAKKIVGWYHTHPSFGIFLSERDMFIQQSFFNLPWQIAMVYDPVKREHGVFAWRDKKPWRVRQYWIGEAEHVWDSPREAPPREDAKTPVVTKPEDGGPKHPTASASAPAAAGSARESFLGEFLSGGWLLPAGAVALLLLIWIGSRYINPADDRQEQVEAVRAAVTSLNADLMGVLRASLGDEGSWKTFDDGLNQLNQAVKNARPMQQGNPAMQPMVQSMEEALQTLDRARKDRRLAYEMLRRIEQMSGRAPGDHGEASIRRIVEDGLNQQRRALGGIYAELADQALSGKNPERARKLLIDAVTVDPDHQSDYEQRLKTIDPKSSFQREPSGKVVIRSGDQASQPAPSPKSSEANSQSKESKTS